MGDHIKVTHYTNVSISKVCLSHYKKIYNHRLSEKGEIVMSIEEYIFTGVTTQNWKINQVKCILKIMKYLKIRDLKCALSNNVMYVMSKQDDHIINLLWHDYGFDLQEDLDELNPLGHEVILVATSVIFRSLFPNVPIVDELEDDDWDDEDLWI